MSVGFSYGCRYMHTESHKQILLLICDCSNLGLHPSILIVFLFSIFPSVSTCHPYLTFDDFLALPPQLKWSWKKISWVMKVSLLIYSHCKTAPKPLPRWVWEARRLVSLLHLFEGHFSTGLP